MLSNEPKEERRSQFWESWWKEDFSWEALEGKGIPSDHTIRRYKGTTPDTLQAYWRSPLEHGPPLTDAQLKDELVTDPSGRIWHIAHVPLHWEDGSPAKATWSKAQLDSLLAAVAKRLSHSLATNAAQEVEIRSMAQFAGVVLPVLSFPGGRANAILRQAYVGSRWELTSAHNETRFLNCFFDGQVNLTHTLFEREAIFENCVFAERICAQYAVCAGMASFCDSVFFGHNLFHECDFSGKAWFHHTTFHDTASFHRSEFKKEAEFNNALFEGEASFNGVAFRSRAEFDSCNFQDRFSFIDCKFERPAYFTCNSWPDPSTSSKDGSVPLLESAFYNAQFLDSAIFTSTTLSPLSSFDGCLFESSLYMDRAAENVESDRFVKELRSASRYPDAERRLDALLGGCQAIRRAMERASDKKAEHLYYRFELMVRERQEKTHFLERLLLRGYKHLSDYGSSISRPIIVFCTLLGLGGFVYGTVLGFRSGTFDFSRDLAFSFAFMEPMLHGLSFSASRSLPFGPWELDTDTRTSLLGPTSSIGSVALRLLATLQSLACAILVFLAALAVRRRFQIG